MVGNNFLLKGSVETFLSLDLSCSNSAKQAFYKKQLIVANIISALYNPLLPSLVMEVVRRFLYWEKQVP